jgi:hypothetical protein
MGEMINVYSTLVGKPEGKRLLGRPRHRWEDKTGMDLREKGWKGVGWKHLAQNRDQWGALVNMVTNLQIPSSQEGLCSIDLDTDIIKKCYLDLTGITSFYLLSIRGASGIFFN